MGKDSKYSIYVAEVSCTETPKSNTMPTWDDINSLKSFYHCFLMLMDETKGNGYDAEIIQQLHFDKNRGKMIPMLPKKDDRYSTVRDLDLFPYVSGDAPYISEMWNEILSFAVEIKEQEIYFGRGFRHDDDAINCRTGVKASLTRVGLTFCNEFTKSTAGTQATDFPTVEVIEVAHHDTDLALIQRRRDELSQNFVPKGFY